MTVNSCAVVLGGYVNGFSIAQELHGEGLKSIALLQYGRQLAGYSNKFCYKESVEKNPKSLLAALRKLNEIYDYLVLFPTDDLFIENLFEIWSEIESFCFIPFNPKNISRALDKFVQYEFCDKLNIPYPKTKEVKKVEDLNCFSNDLRYPLIIKPNKREDLRTEVFRSLRVRNDHDLRKCHGKLSSLISQGVSFLVSEVIPGHTNGTIFGYTAYRSTAGVIMNEWTGSKLTQFPNDYGVFSSASNQCPEIIKEYGRKLLNGMDLYGICEPEFKFDQRDGKYKLMEINLRSMMWHRTGNLSGVKIQYSQWLDAIGEKVPPYKQLPQLVHFVYLKHEIVNLFLRKGYFKYFKNNIFGKGRNELALYDLTDLKPFIYSQFSTAKVLTKEIIKLIIGK